MKAGEWTEPDGFSPFPVVGVGASAGGLEAFRRLLGEIPKDAGMAFVLVQHLAPQHESRLVELLAKGTAIPVVEAAQGMKLAVNHVYIIPPNCDMAVSDGELHLTPREGDHRPHLPIDYLFRSLAEEQQGRAIGVVLSGTGSDGTLGLCEIKAVGGITFAQDARSATHQGMPVSARDSGCVDFVLDPQSIAKRLVQIGAHPYLAPEPGRDKAAEEDYRQILTIVRRGMGVDFSHYRKTTIRRRIMRRMALHSHETMPSYVEHLKNDPDEVNALYHDLLINVTSFFRDPETFDILKQTVFPELARRKSSGQPYRIWVPGCSTGQEAYSLAMALIEFHDRMSGRPVIQLFATDLSDQSVLEKARSGVYAETIEAEVSPERLRRFFKKEGHVYRIDKSIRDMCVFARQNIAADPPFSHLDLISCRNVLIYLAPTLQRRVLPVFHYALDIPGYLVLGSAESVAEQDDLFEPVEHTHKIYQKKAVATRPILHFSADAFRAPGGAGRHHVSVLPVLDVSKESDRILLGRYAPPAVLINQNFDAIQFRGRTGVYLDTPPGEPTVNILKMAREGLFLDLQNALAEAKKTGKVVKRKDVRVGGGDVEAREIGLEVVPIATSEDEAGCFLVIFHDAQAQAKAAVAAAAAALAVRADEARAEAGRATPAGAEREVERLRQELASTKEYLQSMVERQDAANEELRSANEEILSSNEELQSTNEELETAKEELQSTNEELTTVNEQLHHRNAELTEVNNDLTNLLASTNIPLVMVGSDFRIRRYTGSARRLMSLLPSDVGRPIGDIRTFMDIESFDGILTDVIEHAQPYEREVRSRDGRWYTLRVSPYRTADDRIDGAVVLLIDVDQLRRGQDELRQKTDQLKDADRQKDQFLATLAHELRNPIAPMKNAVEIMRLAGDNAVTMDQVREMMDRQIRQLSGIVDDLIDISRIVEKKIELRVQRVRLDSVVRTAVETTRSFIESCGHKLTIELPREAVHLDADPIRLSQVLVNVLNNAAKFTPAGGAITLAAHAVRENNGSVAVVRIRDTGIGIAKDSSGRIFEMFQQGLSPEHGASGLGVGLTLVRSLVQMHGGTVDVRSDGLGTGSEFVLRFPAVDPEAAKVGPTAGDDETVPAAPQHRKVLIVDDNRDQAQSLGKLLQLLGHEVRVSYDGEQALEEVTAFVPDAVLLDIGLPKMNGYEVAERISRDPALGGTLLIAQTGWGQEQDRERTRNAGFDHHLVKPVDVFEVQKILAEGRKQRPA
jgi:two-component system CheB/CheR fusion protein